jgi:hypothetical protein
MKLLPLIIIALCLTGCSVTPAPNGRQASTGGQGIEERVSKLKIGMPESEVISIMGAPLRKDQKLTPGGTETVLVYSRQQFLSSGQSFLEGFREGATDQPSAKRRASERLLLSEFKSSSLPP